MIIVLRTSKDTEMDCNFRFKTLGSNERIGVYDFFIEIMDDQPNMANGGAGR